MIVPLLGPHGRPVGPGRIPPPDRDKDEDYPLRADAKAAAGVSYKYYQSPLPTDDQGGTSQCVAYGGNHWLGASPIRNKKLIPHRKLYTLCQRNDEWPGEEPTYEGTSVRALFKVLKQLGLIENYLWAFDIEPVVNFLLTKGPLVMGTTWTYDMFDTDHWGFVTPTGRFAGGHAWLLDGIAVYKKCPDGTIGAARALNSWGRTWGEAGRFWISLKDLETLILDDGEAGMGTEVKPLKQPMLLAA